MHTVLVTGGYGFIGSHLCQRLVQDGNRVVVVDNCSIADQNLQRARIEWLGDSVEHSAISITDFSALDAVFRKYTFDKVYHLAAKPGVRESITNPFVYVESNYVGTLNVFECAKRHTVSHVLVASSSSVYGRNTNVPFVETDMAAESISVYASTKRAGELLAYTYCDLFGMNITSLRFFTVYGPFGRPDMAPWIFTEKISRGDPIQVYDNGNHQRDFTYIDDIITGIIGAAQCPQGYNILNIGRGEPVPLMEFIETIERQIGVTASKEFVAAQPGDVNVTYADTTKAQKLFGYQPTTSIEVGLNSFVEWYLEYIKNE